MAAFHPSWSFVGSGWAWQVFVAPAVTCSGLVGHANQHAVVLPSGRQRLPAQRVLDPSRHRERLGIALREAQHLQPQRQAAIVPALAG